MALALHCLIGGMQSLSLFRSLNAYHDAIVQPECRFHTISQIYPIIRFLASKGRVFLTQTTVGIVCFSLTGVDCFDLVCKSMPRYPQKPSSTLFTAFGTT